MLIVLLLAVFMFEQKKLVISFLYTFVNWDWVYLEDHFFSMIAFIEWLLSS